MDTYILYRQLIHFTLYMTVGITIPIVITYNQGFNIVANKDCGVRDLVLEVLTPITDYLRTHT